MIFFLPTLSTLSTLSTCLPAGRPYQLYQPINPSTPSPNLKHSLTILSILLTLNLFANTIVVGKDQVITSLRKAVEMAKDDDTILLKKGVYKEGNIIINNMVSKHLI